MGTQTSRATYSRLLVNSFIFGYSFHSVNLILQAVHPLITFDGGGGKAVVLPPCGQCCTDGLLTEGRRGLFHILVSVCRYSAAILAFLMPGAASWQSY